MDRCIYIFGHSYLGQPVHHAGKHVQYTFPHLLKVTLPRMRARCLPPSGFAPRDGQAPTLGGLHRLVDGSSACP